MEWLNEPASWQRTGDVLTVSVDPGTDFWRETGYGYIRDSGHVYGEVLGGDLDVSVRLRFSLGVQYDQAGVMLRADERTWLKTGVEFFEGRARLSTVLTLGQSSWMVTDLPGGTDELGLRVSRRGDAVEVRYLIGDGRAELAALVFLPPGREVLAGVMAAAPEGPGFRVTFQDLRITARDWPAAGDSWQAGQAGWAAAEAPAWSPADGEPGWAVPETGHEAPAWPAAEAVAPAWPPPAARGEDAEWQGQGGEEGEPGWAAGTVADEPGWAAGTVAGEPGRPAAAGEPGWVPIEDRDRVQRAAGADGARQGAPEEPATPGPAEDAAGPQAAPPGTAEDKTEPGPGGEGTAGQVHGGHALGPPAPAAGHDDRAAPAGRGTSAVADPAADSEQLATGAQAPGTGAGPAQAARGRAQPDAEVADEWPGPPRPAMPNEPPGGDAPPGYVAGDAAGEAQTDPGLPRPRMTDPAGPEAGTGPAADESAGATSAAAAAESAGAKTSAPDQGKPAQRARQARRSRSRRAAADQPTEPDAADEWISLLTADPVEE